MSTLKLALMTVVLSGVIILVPGCTSNETTTPTGQVVTVQRGDLKTDITGVGNLALSSKVDLAFEMPGTVAEVLVKEGETVKQGQVLAALDTSAWEDQVTALQRALTDAERKVTNAERQVTSRKRDELQAQINLNNAQITLDNAEEQTTDILELQMKQLAVELNQGKLEDASVAIEDAQKSVDDARTAMNDAQKALEDAKNTTPQVIAPFDGFITKVNVSGGNEIKKGTVAMVIADPAKFEADILVSEMDILQVKMDGAATIQVDAMKGVDLPAKVTYISPSATIQSGVVNYKVKVVLQSLEEIQQQWQAARQQAAQGGNSQNATGAWGGSQLTQEQIDAMIRQRQEATQGGQSSQQAQGRQPSSGQSGSVRQGQLPTMTSDNFKLSEGLTVIVNITVQEKSSVLLVPNTAVISRGGRNYVQVTKDGAVEDRMIEVGISNWQYAEVTSGLEEGEQVIVPKQVSTSPTPTQAVPGGQGGMIVPGMQRIIR